MSYKKTLGDFITDGAFDLAATNFYVVTVRQNGQYEIHAQLNTDHSEAVADLTKAVLTPEADDQNCSLSPLH
jgi:hypothetical protein